MQVTKVERITDVFNQHIKEHKELPESTRQRDLGSEKELIRNYSGRVVFELLQNALDRAGKDGYSDKGRILVAMVKNSAGNYQLIVGNNGLGVSIFPRSQREHSDFHAMLSLHSSTKSANESIGNKGIGFRSVFASGKAVKVFSRESISDGWWGFKLQHPAECEKGTGWTTKQVASFYAPKLISPDNHGQRLNLDIPDDLNEQIGHLVTVVLLPEVKQEAVEDIKKTIELLSGDNMPLDFLRDRTKSDVCITFRNDEAEPPSKHISHESNAATGVFIDAEPFKIKELDLVFKENTGLELDEAVIRIGLLPISNGNDKLHTYFWSYLPTEQPAGFGVHIHGDFCLMNSRRGVSFAKGDGKSPQNYNYILLERAADAIVNKLWQREEVLLRDDFWQLVRPSACESPELKQLVAEKFLEKSVFQNIVQCSFKKSDKHNWKIQRYHDFFDAVYDWVDFDYRASLVPKLGYQPKYKKILEIINWIKEAGAPVLPVVSDPSPENCVEIAVSLPFDKDGKSKRDKTVYLKKSEDSNEIGIPDGLSDRCKLYVTRFQPSAFNAKTEIRMTDFNRVEILRRINPGSTEDQYSESLKFVLNLVFQKRGAGENSSVADTILNDPVGGHPAWRFKEREKSLGTRSPLVRAGESMSNLFVPVTGVKNWSPAGETTYLPNNMKVPASWPWPVLDTDHPIWSQFKPDEPNDFDNFLKNICIVLGVSIGPRLVVDEKDIVIHEFEKQINTTKNRDDYLSHCLAESIINNWDVSFRPIIESSPALKAHLQKLPWVPSDLSKEVAKGQLTVPKNVEKFRHGVRPLDIWLMPGSDFYDLLYGLRITDTSDVPSWAASLEISKLGTRGYHRRIKEALEGLKARYKNPAVDGVSRKLEEVYRRLVRSFDDNLDEVNIPVLVYVREGHGVLKEIRWREENEPCWFDDGKYQWALGAFEENTQVWVVRNEKAKLIDKLGIKRFEPNVEIQPENAHKQNVDEKRSHPCMNKIISAMPYLFTAASLARSGSAEFKDEEALQNWQELTAGNRLPVRYFDDIWWEISFDGLNGQIGKKSQGDIIYDKVNRCILFDSPKPPLIWFSKALSQALCGHEAFVAVFAQVLAAWPAKDDGTGLGTKAHLERLQRDLGFNEAEVDGWKNRITAYTLSEEQVQQWETTVCDCLSQFGKMAEEKPAIGSFVVNRNTWIRGSARDTYFCTQHDVEKALEEAFNTLQKNNFEDAKNLTHLIPPVRIFLSNLAFWEQNREIIAKDVLVYYLAVASPSDWETRKDRGEAILNREPNDEEKKGLEHFLFDEKNIRKILWNRLNIDSSTTPDSDILEKAKRFLEGRIILKDQPVKINLQTKRIKQGFSKINAAINPASDEDYIAKQRKNTYRGRRVEISILEKARSEAFSWLNKEKEQFWGCLKEMLINRQGQLAQFARDGLQTVLMKKQLEGILNGHDESRIGELLQVSEWWGNAGFDILYPDRNNTIFRLVEVKSVTTAQSPAFYLSQNEIYKAFAYLEKGLRWEVWCVDHTGEFYIVEGRQLTDMDSEGQNTETLQDLLAKIRGKGFVPDTFHVELEQVH